MIDPFDPARLLDDAPIGLATLDGALRYVWANPAFAAIVDAAPPELRGRALREVTPSLDEEIVSLFRHVLQSGNAVVNLEISGAGRDRERRRSRWLVGLFPVRDDGGTVVGVNLSVLDITERSAAEEHVRSLLDVSAELAGALTPADVGEVIVAHGLPALGASAGFLALLDEGQRLQIVRSMGYPTAETLRFRGAPLDAPLAITRAIRERAPVFFASAAERELAGASVLLLRPESQAGATVDLPLLVEGRPVGALGAVFPAARELSGFDRDFLAALANETAEALDRARLYESERSARRRAETEHEQRALLAEIVESAEDAIVSTALDGTVTSWNAGATRIFGWTREEMLGQPLDRIVAEDRREESAELRRRIARGERIQAHETERIAKGGRRVSVSLTVWPLRDATGRIVGESRIDRDITARRQLEEQLLQAQKMESIGRLAGGVAHDFNNILTAITGYSELLLAELPENRREREHVEAIRGAAERAASLTRQLLAFSRRQVLQPRIMDPNDIVARMIPLVRRLIGEHIELATSLRATGTVRADPSQLEQVVLNLAVNARDAMPRGGRLSIRTEDAEFDEAYAAEHFEVSAGRYVMLSVSDTGVGMDAATRAHVFEPFFTTKERGKGTGLGLATIYGIVRQSGGHIWLYSEPGQGTTFKVYFPRTAAPVREQEPVRGERPAGGTETVLLVEDEDAVRDLARLVLQRQGYRVLVAANAREALAVEAAEGAEIAILVTDVVMPGLSGPDLSQRIRDRRPAIRTLFLSGYTQDSIGTAIDTDRGIAFLGKPFTPDALARKVREVLSLPAPVP